MKTSTSKPNRLAAAMKANQQGGAVALAIDSEPVTPQPKPQPVVPDLSSKAATRVRTKQIAGHFPPEVARVLKTIGLEQDKTVQVMLGEALDMYFQAHGKATIASRVQDKASA